MPPKNRQSPSKKKNTLKLDVAVPMSHITSAIKNFNAQQEALNVRLMNSERIQLIGILGPQDSGNGSRNDSRNKVFETNPSVHKIQNTNDSEADLGNIKL